MHVADEEKVKYSLSGGDMRRVLNLLQTTAMSSEEVNEITVYLTSGRAASTDVQAISHSLTRQSSGCR